MTETDRHALLYLSCRISRSHSVLSIFIILATGYSK